MLILRVSYVIAALLTVVKIEIIAKYPLKLHILRTFEKYCDDLIDFK